MGYTHSIKIPEAGYEDALSAIPKVARDLRRLHEAGVLPPLAGPNGEGKPEFGGDQIAFNGAIPDDYETCYIGPTKPFPGETRRFYYTKTGRRPYDLAVQVAYALWWFHSEGAVEVGSDGELEDWAPALELIEIEFGYRIDVRDLFDVSYALLRFSGGLEVALELWHQADGPSRETLSWVRESLTYLANRAIPEYREEFGPGILSALQKADLSRSPAVVYHGRDAVPGFGHRRFGAILFADKLSAEAA